MDYYGRKLATCSSDKSIKLFSVQNNEQKLIDTLYGFILFSNIADTKVLFGKWPGLTLNLEIFWLLVHTMEKYVFGEKDQLSREVINGQKLKNTRDIQLPVFPFFFW